jgi:hypothetical protein
VVIFVVSVILDEFIQTIPVSLFLFRFDVRLLSLRLAILVFSRLAFDDILDGEMATDSIHIVDGIFAEMTLENARDEEDHNLVAPRLENANQTPEDLQRSCVDL